VEVTVVAWHAAPSGGLHRAEEMWGLTVGGNVIVPGAVGAVAVLFIFVLCQGVVLRILAIPGDGTLHSSSQTQSPGLVVWGFSSAIGSVSPCQFSSLIVLIHQLQEVFSGICPNKTLSDRLGAPDVS
jgi:hypothetical protein